MTKNVLSIIALLAAVASLVFLLFTRHLFAGHPLLIGVQAAAVLLMIWSRLTFGWRSFHASADATEGGLVTNGPYRYLRHPIYASIIYFVWAGQILNATGRSIAAAAVVTLGMVTRMLLEERSLRAAYPDYAEHSRRARRLIPFVF